MTNANKWNFRTREYEPVNISSECNLYSDDMDEIVECPHCGKKLKYGDSYTSKVIHNNVGFGYAVCEKCYIKELQDENKYLDKENERLAQNQKGWM